MNVPSTLRCTPGLEAEHDLTRDSRVVEARSAESLLHSLGWAGTCLTSPVCRFSRVDLG